MKSGRVVRTEATHDLLFNNQLIRDSGLSVPLIIQIVQRLQQNGWPIDECECLGIDRLMDTMKEWVQ